MTKSIVVLGLLLAQALGQTVVDTQYGQVQGTDLANVFNGGFYNDVVAFHAIPFAKPPVGNLRFRNPEYPEPWSPSLLVADTPGPACPQGGDGRSEDCLHMDITMPAAPGSYPVMVWFYGGAFQSGENAIYPGHFMATHDVVVVVVNYRVGAFGFAYTANDACTGNFGLFDQRLALEFVRDNIANFNGNPNQVTIFGQSAGAASSGHHSVSPISMGEGLFHQAIMESGNEKNFWAINLPESHPENYIREVAGKLNCTGGDDYEMMDCLRTLPWEDIQGTRFDCTEGWYCLGMAPVVDGVFLPDRPRLLRENGTFLNGPIMTGMCDSDGSLYTAAMIPASVLGGFNRTEFLYWLERNLMSIWAPLFDNATAQQILNAVDFNYTPWPHIEDEYENREAFNKMITDAAFAGPMDKQMRHHNQYAPIYGFRYGYRGRNSSDVVPEWMGVPHSGELPQTWGWPLLKYNEHVRNDTGGLEDFIDWTEEDKDQTFYWQTMYSNFAKFGNPTPSPVPDPLGGMTDWRPFTDDDMAYLYVYNTTLEVRTDFRPRNLAFFDEYMSYLGDEFFSQFPETMASGAGTGKGIPAGMLAEFEQSFMQFVGFPGTDKRDDLMDFSM